MRHLVFLSLREGECVHGVDEKILAGEYVQTEHGNTGGEKRSLSLCTEEMFGKEALAEGSRV